MRRAASLKAFETSLETPIVPGELVGWVASARTSCVQAVGDFRERVHAWHKTALKLIDRNDPDLANRVKQLRDKDTELLRQARIVQRQVDKLAADADALPSHDPTIKDQVPEIIKSGVNWIIRVRTQEQALTTWYQESLNRDRGVAD